MMDSVEDALDWLSFRSEPTFPQNMKKDFATFVDAVLDPIDEMTKMVNAAREYFKTYSEEQRVSVMEIIRTLRHQEHKADQLEYAIKQKIFSMDIDPVTIFHIVRLSEIIGNIADHAENAGDMMRAMIAK